MFADLSGRATAGRELMASSGRFRFRREPNGSSAPFLMRETRSSQSRGLHRYGSRWAHGVFEALRRDGE